MPFDLSIPELLVILLAALLIFGPKRLPEMGRSLGKGIREFKSSVSGITEAATSEPAEPTTAHSPPPSVSKASLAEKIEPDELSS